MSKVYLKTKQDYKLFVHCELSRDICAWVGMKNTFFPNAGLKFIKKLRRMEYHYNNLGWWHKLMAFFSYVDYYRWSLRTGISIPKNTCDRGLTLYHFGSIVINAGCEIGKNCCIMNNVNIGANQGSSIAPRIGNDVYIGPGAVIFGDIEIADGCYIGANAVVNKSFHEPHSVIVGIPAKVVKTDPVNWWEKNGLVR